MTVNTLWSDHTLFHVLCPTNEAWIHILYKSFVVLAHINDSSSLHCTENFGLVVTLVLWSVLKLSAVDSPLSFLSFMTFFYLADPCTDFEGFSHAFW